MLPSTKESLIERLVSILYEENRTDSRSKIVEVSSNLLAVYKETELILAVFYYMFHCI